MQHRTDSVGEAVLSRLMVV
jgi:hypothetical protein